MCVCVSSQAYVLDNPCILVQLNVYNTDVVHLFSFVYVY